MRDEEVVLKRLLSHVQPVPWSGCWLWTGPVYGLGYPGIKVQGRSLYAHRLSYELHKGPIPPGMEVDHLCWVPFCVNPDHLEAVTSEEHHRRNALQPHGLRSIDRRGQRNPRARLTQAQAYEIKCRRAEGESGASLAREFNISPETVSAIHCGRQWGWL